MRVGCRTESVKIFRRKRSLDFVRGRAQRWRPISCFFLHNGGIENRESRLLGRKLGTQELSREVSGFVFRTTSPRIP